MPDEFGFPTDAEIERARIIALEKVGLEDECPACGGDGIVDDGSCTCGDDTCCCAEPESPDCPVCDGTGFAAKRPSTPTSAGGRETP